MEPGSGGGMMAYSVPKDGTATCLVCQEKFKSWRRDPMNPCPRCGSFAVLWSPELFRELPDQEKMAKEWLIDQQKSKTASQEGYYGD